MTISIYWQIFEDDETCSALWQDLRYVIRESIEYPQIQIKIHYHSKKAYGSYLIFIANGMYQMTPLEKEIRPNHKNHINDVKKLLSSFSPSHRNIFILSGHMNIFFKTHKWNSTDVFKEIDQRFTFDLIVMDSCTSSYWPWLLICQNRCDYLLGCESTSPYLGFIGKNFLHILMNDFYKKKIENAAKKWIDLFITRNENAPKPYKMGRCDASMIDMSCFRQFVLKNEEECKKIFRYMSQHKRELRGAKLEFDSHYPLYDVVKILQIVNSPLEKEIKDCILYVKINKMQRKYLKRNQQTSTVYKGISIFL